MTPDELTARGECFASAMFTAGPLRNAARAMAYKLAGHDMEATVCQRAAIVEESEQLNRLPDRTKPKTA